MAWKIKLLILSLLAFFNFNRNNLLNNKTLYKYYNNNQYDKIIKFYEEYKYKFLMNEKFFIIAAKSYYAQNNYIEVLKTLRKGIIYNPNSKEIKDLINKLITEEKAKLTYLNLFFFHKINIKYIFITTFILYFLFIIFWKRIKKIEKFYFLIFNLLLIFVFLVILIYPQVFYNEAIVIEDSFIYNFPNENSTIKDKIKTGNIIKIKYIKDEYIYFFTIYGKNGWIHKNNIEKVF
ncbi:MAG: hypothetical protein N3A58_03870 [Spirochaetes bacterium]|nr:hypothetical protein [Spirochaetota bacterium]